MHLAGADGLERNATPLAAQARGGGLRAGKNGRADWRLLLRLADVGAHADRLKIGTEAKTLLTLQCLTSGPHKV